MHERTTLPARVECSHTNVWSVLDVLHRRGASVSRLELSLPGFNFCAHCRNVVHVVMDVDERGSWTRRKRVDACDRESDASHSESNSALLRPSLVNISWSQDAQHDITLDASGERYTHAVDEYSMNTE